MTQKSTREVHLVFFFLYSTSHFQGFCMEVSLFGNVYRVLNSRRRRERKNIVHCVKCFIRKMFCIISIFIVFIAYAEFPKAEKPTINAAELICCFSVWTRRKEGSSDSESRRHIYFRSTKYHKKAILQGVNKSWKKTVHKGKTSRLNCKFMLSDRNGQR